MGIGIRETLDDRSITHGDFTDQAGLSIALKTAVARTTAGKFTPVQREAIHMILHKIARIACGNPNEPDHWVDIAGYATLVADRLQAQASALQKEKEEHDRQREYDQLFDFRSSVQQLERERELGFGFDKPGSPTTPSYANTCGGTNQSPRSGHPAGPGLSPRMAEDLCQTGGTSSAYANIRTGAECGVAVNRPLAKSMDGRGGGIWPFIPRVD